jgi:hypothetical protein
MTLVQFFAMIAFVVSLGAVIRYAAWPWAAPVANFLLAIAVLIMAFGEKIHV